MRRRRGGGEEREVGWGRCDKSEQEEDTRFKGLTEEEEEEDWVQFKELGV